MNMKIFELLIDKKIIYLIIGFITAIFSISKFNFPIFIFIWPYCFLTYLHQVESKIIPLILVSICILFSNMIRWIGSADMGALGNFLFGGYFGIVNIIPFIIDGILYNRIEKWASIFIFPLLVAFIEFVFAFCPIANNNCYAYALRDNIQFIQITSLFGTHFISFIIALFASILDYSLQLYKSKKELSKFIYCYAAIILFIFIFGYIRLLIPEDGEKNSIVAALGSSPCLYVKGEESVLPIDDYMDYINKTIIRANQLEANLIIYSEEAFATNKDEKYEIISRTEKLAKENNIFVVLSLDVEYDGVNSNKNEAILISNKGSAIYNYQKQHLIPLMEDDYFEDLTDIKLQYTDLGKLAIAICYDIAFPDYINMLSRDGLDLLLVPSWDWEAITEFHSVNSRFRAIENGINIIKSTANGIVLSTDYKGRFLSYYKPTECEDYFVVSNINKKGVRTLFSYIGIVFNYFYLLATIILVIVGFIMKIKNEKNNIESKNSENLIGLNEVNVET